MRCHFFVLPLHLMEYDIFISYSRADSDIVDTFVQRLESAGYKVWIDKAGIYTGARFKSVLVKAIEDSKVFLFFSSENSNASPWTAKEVAIAVDRKKTIIPIKLDNTRYNRDVEFDLIGLDFVDYKDKSNRNEEFNKLLRSLEIVFDRKPIDSLEPRIKTDESKEKKIAGFLNNHRRWVIPLAVISLLLLIGVPLYFSSNGGDHSLKVEKQVESDAEKKYKKAAEQGDAEAQYNLGRCYYDGDGVTQNYKMAIQWFKKAAEQGHATAQNSLGICYYNGEGVKPDPQEAVKWYRKAAEQGYAEAQSNLALCYENSRRVTGSYEEAAKWFIKAAEQGYAYAQYRLGDYYFYGHYFKMNREEAMKWYKKAAEQGYDKAQNRLGHCYYGGWGVTQDYKEAVKWYKMAAEQGHAESQYWLGYCYFEGQGVKPDHQEAVKWYRKAAEQGDKNVQLYLGDRYYEGRGVTQDFEEAIKWYKRAALQSDEYSQYKLGRCYEEGNGVKIDKEEALKWYKKAAENGHKEAKNAVERLTGRQNESKSTKDVER